MADDRGEIRHVNWAELFSFTQIFKGFRLAIHPSKMLLAFAAIALTWGAAQGLQCLWKLSTTQGYAMPDEIAHRAQKGNDFAELRKKWLDERVDAAAGLARDARSRFAGGFRIRAALSSSPPTHFEVNFSALYEEKDKGKEFESAKLDSDAAKDVKASLRVAQREADIAHGKLATLIDKAYSQAKEQVKDGRRPAAKDGKTSKDGKTDEKGLSDKEKKEAMAQVEKDYAKALKALADQRAGACASADAIRGKGLFTTFVEHEWMCLSNALDAVTDGRIFTGMPSIADGSGEAGASGMGFIAWGVAGLAGVTWLLGEHMVFGLILLVVTLAIWSLLGGAIHRMAAVQATRDEKISLKQAVQFAFSKWPSFFTAPLIPLAVAFVFGALIMLCGLAGNLWGPGAILMGVMLVLAILMGLAIAFIAVGLMTGCGLMYPTIAVEGSDSFDAISRSFAYVYAKPWRAGWYAVVALVYGVVCYVFVRMFAWVALMVTQGFLRWGCFQGGQTVGESDKVAAMWPTPAYSQLLPDISWAHLSGMEAVGAGFMWVWIAVVVCFVNAFLLSYASSAGTMIYLLLRRHVDATDMADVYVPEPQDQPLPEQPAVTPATTAATTTMATTESSATKAESSTTKAESSTTKAEKTEKAEDSEKKE